MRRHITLLVLFFICSFTPTLAAGIILLNADFEGKPVDQPIGTGGPAVGEPVSVNPNVVATIRNSPMPTTCLEVADNDDYSAGWVEFEFMETDEVAFAAMTVSANLWFTEEGMGDHYTFCIVGETSLGPHTHASVFFINGNRVHISDTVGYDTDIGSYSVNRSIPLLIELDLATSTYDLWLDNVLILDNRPHAFSELGINELHVACGHDPDLTGAIYVDDLMVVATLPPVATDSAAWSLVKAMYR